MATKNWTKVRDNERETVWVRDVTFDGGDVLRVVVAPWGGGVEGWLIDMERAESKFGSVQEEFGESGRYPDASREARTREEAERIAKRMMDNPQFVMRAWDFLSEKTTNPVDEALGL